MSKILTHRVLKQFNDDGVDRLPGECVDALPWHNAESMEHVRMIAPLPDGLQAVEDSEGRWWMDAGMLEHYGREPVPVRMEAKKRATGSFPKMVGPKVWDLSDGTRFRGRKIEAQAAEAALVGA